MTNARGFTLIELLMAIIAGALWLGAVCVIVHFVLKYW